MDFGEVIALVRLNPLLTAHHFTRCAQDIPYNLYSTHEPFYKEAFTLALARALKAPLVRRDVLLDQLLSPLSLTRFNSIDVTNYQNSTAGTVLITFDFIFADYDGGREASAAVKALFCAEGGGDVVLGSPSCPSTESKKSIFEEMRAVGLPVQGVYYNDQTTPAAIPLPSPPFNTYGNGKFSYYNSSLLATWAQEDPSEVIALDIPYSHYADNQQYYKEAFSAGFALALGLRVENVFVAEFHMSASGTTLVFVNIILDHDSMTSTDNTPLYDSFANVKSLFLDCGSAERFGCPAKPASRLVEYLQSFGLPISMAYYNDQLPPA